MSDTQQKPGITEPNAATSRGKEARGAEIRERIMLMRRAGYSLQQIGDKVGLRKQSVHRHVKVALAAHQERTEEYTADVLALELDRLDALFQVYWPRRGEPRVVDLLLKIMDRRARFLGTDAPVRQDHSGKIALEATVMPMTAEERAARVAAILAEGRARVEAAERHRLLAAPAPKPEEPSPL